LLRLFEWTKDFNLNTQRNTHAQVWIRLMALPQEYWMDRTLREIASAVGTPLLIDNATSKRLFGHYARILVDMDFSRKIFYEIVVEREGFAFPVEVVYERMPDFCTHCQNIGHHVSVCRWIHPRKENENNTEKEKIVQGKKQMPTQRLEWVPFKDNPLGIGSSAVFQSPQTVRRAQENSETHAPSQQQLSQIVAAEEALPTHNSSPQPIPTALDNEEIHVSPQQQLPVSTEDTLPLQHSSPHHVPSEGENLETHATNQQQPMRVQAGQGPDIHSTEEFVALETTLHDEAEAQHQHEGNLSSIQAATVQQNEITVNAPNNSFTLQYMNVTKEVGRNVLGADHDTVLSPITEKSLDISSTVATSDAPVNLLFQKEVDFMNNWLAKAAENDTPFMQVISKAQKKEREQEY